jgi:hypothetical protein
MSTFCSCLLLQGINNVLIFVLSCFQQKKPDWTKKGEEKKEGEKEVEA